MKVTEENLTALLDNNPLRSTEISRFYGLSESQAANRVAFKKLAKKGRVKKLKRGGYAVYYLEGQENMARKKVDSITKGWKYNKCKRYIGGAPVDLSFLDLFDKGARLTVKEIVEKTGMDRPEINKILKSLVEIGLLRREETGKRRYGKPEYVYSVNPDSPYKTVLNGWYHEKARDMALKMRV